MKTPEMLSYRRLLALLLCVISCSGVAAAQDKAGSTELQEDENDNPQQRMLEQAMKRSLDQLKKKYETRMAVRLKEITEVCKLDDAQVRKLRMASKGSIVKALADQKQHMEEMQAMFHEEPVMVEEAAEPVAEGEPASNTEKPADGDDSPKEDVPAEEPQKEEPQPKDPTIVEEPIAVEGVAIAAPAMAVDFAAVGMGMTFMGSELPDNFPWNQSVWLETVKATLTEEQFKTLDTFDKERVTRTQRSRIQAIVQNVDTELHLNDKQRTEIGAWLEKEFAPFFMDPNMQYMFMGSGMTGGNFFVQLENGEPNKPADPAHMEVVAKILTPDQLELWKGSYMETFRTLESMKNQENGNPLMDGIQQILGPFR